MPQPPPTMTERLALRQRPMGAPLMYQKWRQLLFLHWQVAAEVVQSHLPPGLTVDTFQGSAYVGLIPFFMRRVRFRWLPPLPGTANFLETNIRTYVYDQQGRPGVWFFSLDAASWLAVRTARLLYSLPYFWARMQATQDSHVDYVVQRRGQPEPTRSHFIYGGKGDVFSADPGTLEFFLAERYLLFSYDRGKKRIGTGQVHHLPYPLQRADLLSYDANLFALDGLELPGRAPDDVLFSPGVDVEVFGLAWQ